MEKTENEETISKKDLLDWLYTQKRNVSVSVIAEWLKKQTNCKYKIIQTLNEIKKDKKPLG